MISQEDFNVISRFDSATSEQRAAILQQHSQQVGGV